MPITKEDVIIMKLDTPNKNGRVYTTEAVEKAIANLPKVVYGELGSPTLNRNQRRELELSHPADITDPVFRSDMLRMTTVDALRVSHKVTNMRIENGNWLGDVTVVNTISGQMLQQMLEGVDFRPRSTGTFSIRPLADGALHKVVSDINLISIDAVIEGS